MRLAAEQHREEHVDGSRQWQGRWSRAATRFHWDLIAFSFLF
jgi:hypothetical protein